MNGAHLHLVLNHIPVLGVLFGFIILVVGAARSNTTLIRTALVTFVVAACAAVPAYLTGEPAEHIVKGLAGVSKAAVEAHESAAKLALVASLVLGIVSAAALFVSRGAAQVSRAFVAGILLLSLGTVGAMAWTANLGGQIHHPEIGSSTTGQTLAPSRQDDDD